MRLVTHPGVALVAAVLLGGCASSALQDSLARRDALLAARGQALAQAPLTLPADGPLTRSEAIAHALQTLPQARMAEAELAVALAQSRSNSLPTTPSLGLGLLRGSTPMGAVQELTASVSMSLVDLLLLPARRAVAAQELSAAEADSARQLQTLAQSAEAAWIDAVAAQQLALLADQQADAARLTAEFARRLHGAGNLPARALAEEEANAASYALAARADATAAHIARQTLAVAMGLSPTATLPALPNALPPLPTAPDFAPLYAQQAQQRLDIAATQQRAAALAAASGLAQPQALLGGVTLGAEQRRETNNPTLTGPSLALALPWWDWGGNAKLAAQGMARHAAAESLQTQQSATLQLHAAQQQWDLATAQLQALQQQVLPQRRTAREQAQRELDSMLIGLFDAMGTRQAEYAAEREVISTTRDAWIAYSQIGLAYGAALPTPPQASHAPP